MNKNKSGFVWASLLLLIVMIGVAAVGYYVWHVNHKKTISAQSANTVQITQIPSTSATAKTSEDLTKLPLGDGKVTTSSPQSGYVYSCTNNFRGGGASHSGSWIAGTTWNLTTKPKVDGSVSWPNATVSITKQGSQRIISSNGLPVDTMTGVFPISPSGVAYQYDHNPNSIKLQTVLATLDADPAMSSSPSCLGLGIIGYMTNGVALFDALDDAGRDAAAHEIQDKCDGHPQMSGIYHYHSLSNCLEAREGNNQLLGYALDGYGIFGSKDATGNIITNNQLDACHGLTSAITWDGKKINMYHYVLNHEYPYSLGCFRGAPIQTH